MCETQQIGHFLGFWVSFGSRLPNLTKSSYRQMQKHQRKKKSKGRNRREYKRTPSRKHSVNNFWIRIVERNRFPDLTSFWLHFTLKECSLKFPKGSPHELPNFRQSLHWQMYDVPYSMYGFLQLIADGSPNKHQRTKKSKGRNRREYKRTPSLHQKGMRIRHRSWGVPFGELEKIIFKYNMKRNWSFRGTCFLVETF